MCVALGLEGLNIADKSIWEANILLVGRFLRVRLWRDGGHGACRMSMSGKVGRAHSTQLQSMVEQTQCKTMQHAKADRAKKEFRLQRT